MSNNFFIFGPIALIGLTLAIIALTLFVLSFFQRDRVPQTSHRHLDSREASESLRNR